MGIVGRGESPGRFVPPLRGGGTVGAAPVGLVLGRMRDGAPGERVSSAHPDMVRSRGPAGTLAELRASGVVPECGTDQSAHACPARARLPGHRPAGTCCRRGAEKASGARATAAARPEPCPPEENARQRISGAVTSWDRRMSAPDRSCWPPRRRPASAPICRCTDEGPSPPCASIDRSWGWRPPGSS